MAARSDVHRAPYGNRASEDQFRGLILEGSRLLAAQIARADGVDPIFTVSLLLRQQHGGPLRRLPGVDGNNHIRRALQLVPDPLGRQPDGQLRLLCRRSFVTDVCQIGVGTGKWHDPGLASQYLAASSKI